MESRPSPPGGAGALRWHLLVGFLILASAGLRLAYLGYRCPLDLAPDEAHYWDWSRHLDWSYYSKGPVVALLVRGGTALAGAWSERLTGTEVLAVRLPAVICGALLLLSLYVLTLQVLGRRGLAAAVVALGLTLPPVGAGSLLMTIDAPFTCCWGWALVLGYRAAFRPSWWAWPAAGFAVGIGILAKYTMLLWPASFALFLACSRERRRFLLRPGFWVMNATAAACCTPIVVWNAAHDWVGLRHVLGEAGYPGDGPGVRWLGPFAYLGVQFALLVGFWFVAWAAAMTAYRPGKEPDGGKQYLWWMSAPVFAVFLAFSLRTPVQPNWPVTAYLSGLVLAAGWLAGRPRAERGRVVAGVAVAGIVGLILNVTMLHSEWVHPVLARVAGPANRDRPPPLRRLDPTCRLRGWRELAARVDQARAELRRAGAEPVVAAAGWTMAGELAFYCDGCPTVYSLGVALGDRCSQYDLWRPNPVRDPERFRGRSVVFVGEVSDVLRRAFDRVDPPQEVVYQEAGRPIARWTVVVCRGYRGFQVPLTDRRY